MSSDAPGPIVETPPLIAYRELVYGEGQRPYEFAVLLVEDPSLARTISLQAFERTWNALRRRSLYLDVDEQLYWNITREAARRLAKSREVRGYQPPTTGDDRHITAVGVLEALAPEQRAAVYLAVRYQLGYVFAGTASGIGEARTRDVVYAARQEYREARESGVSPSAEHARFEPLLSALADGQLTEQERMAVEEHLATCPVCQRTLEHYQDFSRALAELSPPSPDQDPMDAALAIPAGRPDRPLVGWRRVISLLNGPLSLLVLFVVGFFVYTTWCNRPPVQTGVGRTSDLVFAQADNGRSILVLESGSGRELTRLPGGAVAAGGRAIYTDVADCGPTGCATTVSRTDTATGETTQLTRVSGRLHVVAADQERIYLADEGEGWNRLHALDLRTGQLAESVRSPGEFQQTFGPQRPLLGPQGDTLFTLARSQAEGQLAVLATRLSPLRVEGWVPLPGRTDQAVGLELSADGRRLFVYFPADGTVQEIDTASETILRSARVQREGPRPESAFVPSGGALIASDRQGGWLYCLLPAGGIAVLDQTSLEVARELATERRYRSIGVSTDGGWLYALGFDGSYRVLNALTGAQEATRGEVRAEDILVVAVGE